ncbi:MAG: DUF1465 family protein [Rickettsiales bacterium]
MKENPNTGVALRSEGRFVFLQKNYDETLALLQQCGNYLEYRGKYERIAMDVEERVLYTIATSHITVQLTSVLSWLMAWKAVEAGEIKRSDLTLEKYRLQDIHPLTADQIDMFKKLAQPVPSLIEASGMLYMRMRRLEKTMLGK